MSNVNDLKKIVAKVRRVWGNEAVEIGGGSKDFVYRITCPNGERVQLHGTASDRNWEQVVWRQLNDNGFAKDEEAYNEKVRVETQARLEVERKKAEEKAERMASQAAALARAAGVLTAQPADPRWILSKHEYPETRRVLIGPELAKEILENYNTANRRLLPTRIARWRRVMENGQWAYTHQGIAFSSEGVLLDGQHRLATAAELGFTLDINVTVGLPWEAFTKVDTGVIRSAADAAYLTGKHEFSNTFSGAARLIKLYEAYGPMFFNASKNQRFSNDEIVAEIEKLNGDLDVAVEMGHELRRVRSAPRISPIVLAAGYYLFSQHDPANVYRDSFFTKLTTLEGVQPGDPELATHTYFSNVVAARKLPVNIQFAILIKAWNARVRNRHVTIMRFAENESFPAIDLVRS